jgi:hypothetical protein
MLVIMSGGSRTQREEIESGSLEAQETATRAGETRIGTVFGRGP